MENIVYIAHCIDTEGPLYESIEATFERIEKIFGIKIEPTKNNLKKLQNKEIDLKGKQEAVAKMVNRKNLDYKDTWGKIDATLNEITSEKFRKIYPDSFGNGWIYNWFCLDHVGYTGENPRRRDIGFHNIFDHYLKYNKENKIKKDMIQWHYHPLPIIKDAHRSGLNYVNSPHLFEILARKIIDRMWFPAAYRPGFHTERPDSNWFLEQWIPFDYANQSMKKEDNNQPDLSKGRFGDWRRAPKKWKVYHPDHDDYQKEGNCRRWIARCLNIDTRLRVITIDDVRDAFKRADHGNPTLLSFTNHDFRDMKSKILKIKNMIKKVSSESPKVKFKYCNAVEAMREVIGIKEKELLTPDFNVEIEKRRKTSKLKIKTKNDIFGPQPFFAVKTKIGGYIWSNLDFQEGNNWSFTFDYNTLPIDSIEKIGIAANTNAGVTEVIVKDLLTNKTDKNVLNI